MYFGNFSHRAGVAYREVVPMYGVWTLIPRPLSLRIFGLFTDVVRIPHFEALPYKPQAIPHIAAVADSLEEGLGVLQ